MFSVKIARNRNTLAPKENAGNSDNVVPLLYQAQPVSADAFPALYP